MKHYIYIVECSDHTYYIGYTTDVGRRVHEHNTSKKGAKYTKTRRPVTLRYTEEYPTLSEARKREEELKKWERSKKERLWRA